QVAEYADGWMPIGGSGLRAALPRLRAALEGAGRDPGQVEVVPFATPPDHGKLDHYERLGVTETVFDLPSGPREELLPVIVRYAALVAERRGWSAGCGSLGRWSPSCNWRAPSTSRSCSSWRSVRSSRARSASAPTCSPPRCLPSS